LFNFHLPTVICGSFVLGQGLPCANAFSVLLISGHGEFKTGLFKILNQVVIFKEEVYFSYICDKVEKLAAVTSLIFYSYEKDSL